MELKTLSGSELEIMTVLWESESPMSVSELLERFALSKGWKVTTVSTFVTRLKDKGFLTVGKGRGAKVYFPSISKEQYDLSLAKNVIDTSFNGSAVSMVVSLWDGKAISREELEQLRGWIDKLG